VVVYSTQQLLEVYVRYENSEDVQWDAFENIEQQFESRDYNYVIGTIYLEKLLQEEWQLNNKISLVLKGIVDEVPSKTLVTKEREAVLELV